VNNLQLLLPLPTTSGCIQTFSNHARIRSMTILHTRRMIWIKLNVRATLTCSIYTVFQKKHPLILLAIS